MSKLKLTTLANIDDTKSVPVDTVVQGSAKAWVNFNGTGTVAIRAAFNVSSITDIGAGRYAVNFANPMPDANFVALVWGGNPTMTNGWSQIDTLISTPAGVSLSTVSTAGPVAVDWPYINVAIFR